jgi:hypothetical protein
MIKNNAQLLNTLINEIESAINNNGVSKLGTIKNSPNNAISGLNYKDLLNAKQLPWELKNELGFLIQTYGNELLYFINQHCPPMTLSMALSLFIFENEKHKVKNLKKQLNHYIDLEDIILILKILKCIDWLTF